jgi:anthraniloyl-CoA monooxygenase
VRSVGHGFSGIARKELLRILTDRARELGVELVFDHEVGLPELDAIRRDADLVLAADGVNSIIRSHLADHFKPSIDRRKCKYIWLGTDLRLESFTFLFEKNEHGVFQVHAYPFDATHSTFIVECDEASWRAAGLHEASADASVAYLEKVFAKHLHGHKLLTNKSQWVSFPTIKNARWHHENVVLMGDAAHTAHYSIGSGTKLAMEDAIVLASALEANRGVPAALEAYDQARRPMVDRIQHAAQDSLRFFENIKRYWEQTPLEFAFNLLTRSKRITYENLKLRDPDLVGRVATRFAETCGVSPTNTPPMFTPLTLGTGRSSMTVENRVVVSPMCMYSAKDGLPDDFHLVHYGSRAHGGAGLIFTEMTDVSPAGRITPGCTGLWSDDHARAWKRIVDFVHTQSGAKFAVQLGHAGRKGATKLMWEGMDEPLPTGAWPLISASAIPYYPRSQTPKAMDKADMVTVTADFVRSARLAEQAGFDMIELHMAHGYLLASFLSPLTNIRNDEYGGAIESRARFPLEVLDAVRRAWPNKPISARISAVDWKDGGQTEEDSVAFAKLLSAHGCDIIHVSTGQTVADAQPVYGRMWQTRFADRIRHEANVKVIAVGNIASGDQINTIIAAGRADLCALARPHLADPSFTLRAASEQGWTVPWPVQYLPARPAPKP